MSRQKYIAGLMWILAAVSFAWCLSLNLDSSYERSNELNRVNQTLLQLSKNLGGVSESDKLIGQTARNLQEVSEGAVLLEERGLHIASLLMLVTLGFASLNLVLRTAQPSASEFARNATRDGSSSSPNIESFRQTLSETIEELAGIKAQLQFTKTREPKEGSSLQAAIENQSNDIVALEGQLVFIQKQAEQLSSQNAKALENLRRLSGQADDNSNFSAAVRLEWNGLAIKLQQFKESQDRVRVQVDMLGKMQKSCQELLIKSLEFSTTHAHHSERGKADSTRMYEESKGITEIFSKLMQAMAVSHDDVDLANKLVKGLSERAEEIVNIIDVIDDIAEQTNQLALNASIEAARAGEQGKGFAVVAAEVRLLAARSSTATRSITELLETIQTEANRASDCLEKTNHSVGTAHGRIVEVDHRCRETMNLSRQVASDLSDLSRITKQHSQDIQSIEKQSLEVTRMTSKITRELNEVDQINSTVHSESNHLAVHTDRLSRLMNRQYFAIQHSERLVEGQTEGLSRLLSHGMTVLEKTRSLRSDWEAQYRGLLTIAPILPKSKGNGEQTLFHRVEFCQTNLDIIRGRTRTLKIAKDHDSKISFDPDVGNDEDDDRDFKGADANAGALHSGDDIAIDSKLDKAG